MKSAASNSGEGVERQDATASASATAPLPAAVHQQGRNRHAVADNIGTMRKDRNLIKRAITISIGGPLIVFLAVYSKYTVLILALYGVLTSMFEFNNVKRHLKVVLLGASDSDIQEFPIPVPTNRAVDYLKCSLGATVPICACIGPTATSCMNYLLWMYVICRTLIGLWSTTMRVPGSDRTSAKPTKENDGKGSSSLSVKNSRVPRGLTLAQVQNFERQETELRLKHPVTEVLVDVLLEMFGFHWILGISVALLSYELPLFGFHITVAAFVGNLMNDIFALLMGRALKGSTHALFPSVSPNKSVEGAAAGIAANTVFMIVWLTFSTTPAMFGGLPILVVGTVVGLLTGVAGVLGDLVQSLIKRVARVKDMGVLVPGHGGVLDRIDGMLFAMPLTYWIACALTAYRNSVAV